MKICIAHGGDISEPSGGSDRVRALVHGFLQSGFDVTLVVPRPNNQLPTSLSDAEIVPVLAPANPLLRAVAIMWRAKQVVAQHDARLQIEHSTLAGVSTLIGCSNYVVDMHDLAYPSPRYNSSLSGPIKKKIIYQLEKRGVANAAHVVVVSSPIKEILEEEWDIPAADITVIPNGFSRELLEQYNDVQEVPGRIGFIGTLHPKLDLETFVELAKLPEVESVQIIGDGAARSNLERLVRREGVQDTVQLNGRLPDNEAYPLLASSQVTVYPLHQSEHTRMLVSVKLFTYSALGKAIVLDDVSESETWTQYKAQNAALFADPTDRTDFLRKVTSLLRNEGLRDGVASNAKMVSKEYTWEQGTQQMVDLYRGESF